MSFINDIINEASKREDGNTIGKSELKLDINIKVDINRHTQKKNVEQTKDTSMYHPYDYMDNRYNDFHGSANRCMRRNYYRANSF